MKKVKVSGLIVEGNDYEHGFRPVFLVSLDAVIISGDGKTADTAYELGAGD